MKVLVLFLCMVVLSVANAKPSPEDIELVFSDRSIEGASSESKEEFEKIVAAASPGAARRTRDTEDWYLECMCSFNSEESSSSEPGEFYFCPCSSESEGEPQK
ncbi:uncharacterized protein LOC106077533 isoform X1 [Biomphalaria glabrata]|uniref:Uncharacterized protein LOC106077533 isoform X1 n=1 Tax=Biomphalaria glabrata TaxID=6526 RepID=A0A9W2YWA1_BIOGL|nr:uncharacterized protein LOC106077533 isoform X1 [Biomphalaria glabrata]XP_055866959.1 uncharacterized protein LOC106077533 isoform X1 [Biomphalaria glabrata]